MKRLWVVSAAALASFWAISAGLQVRSGAYSAELGEFDDEPSHYVTARMVRDYTLSGRWTAPVEFALEYYHHYPKVAIGHWPPVLYGVAGLWMTAVAPTRASAFAFLALVAALLAYLIFQERLPAWGFGTAFLLGATFLSLPLVRQLTYSFMAELPTVLLVFFAGQRFGRFAEQPCIRHALGFGCVAALAILTKPVALLLALVPPVFVLIGRRFDLVRRFDFWMPALIVVAACGPWYWFTYSMAHEGWVRASDAGVSLARILSVNLSNVSQSVGVALVLFALLGVAIHVIVPLTRGARPEIAAATHSSLLLSAFLFLTVVAPVTELRHFSLLIPSMLVLAMAGARSVAGLVAPSRSQAFLACALMIAAFLPLTAQPARKANRGVVAAMRIALSRQPAAIFASARRLEGAFVAEALLQGAKPTTVVYRGTKLLAHSSWSGHDYRLTVKDASEADQRLIEAGVDVVICSRMEAVEAPHQVLVRQAMEAHPERWRRISPVEAAVNADLFEFVGDREASPAERVWQRP